MDIANWKIRKIVTQIRIMSYTVRGMYKRFFVSEVTTRRSDDSCVQRVARSM